MGNSMKMHRIKINIPDGMYRELEDLSKRDGRSIEEIFKIALGLRAHYEDARQMGNRMIIANSDGEPIKELVL